MLRYKYCCDGQNAVLITPIKSEFSGVKWTRGIYRCKKCRQYTIRSETDKLKAFNTKVEIISEEEAQKFIKEKKEFLAKKRKETAYAD